MPGASSKKSIIRGEKPRGEAVMAGAIDAARIAARHRFDPPMRVIADEMRILLGGRRIRDLQGTDAVRFLSLMLTVNTLALARKQFMWDCLAARLERMPATDFGRQAVN